MNQISINVTNTPGEVIRSRHDLVDGKTALITLEPNTPIEVHYRPTALFADEGVRNQQEYLITNSDSLSRAKTITPTAAGNIDLTWNKVKNRAWINNFERMQAVIAENRANGQSYNITGYSWIDNQINDAQWNASRKFVHLLDDGNVLIMPDYWRLNNSGYGQPIRIFNPNINEFVDTITGFQSVIYNLYETETQFYTLPSGQIYVASNRYNGIIDLEAKTWTNMNDILGHSYNSDKSIMLSNGYIMFRRDEYNVYLVDSINLSVIVKNYQSVFGNVLMGPLVELPDGRVLYGPRWNDPSARTGFLFDLMGNPISSFPFPADMNNLILIDSTHVLCITYYNNDRKLYILNIEDLSFEDILSDTPYTYGSPILLPDGKVFIINYNGANSIIDPVTKTVFHPNAALGNNWHGSDVCLLPDGRIFLGGADGAEAPIVSFNGIDTLFDNESVLSTYC